MIRYLIALLPSPLKIAYYRWRGAKIGKGCYIGLTPLDAKDIELGDCVWISSFNLIHRLNRLVLGDGARISGFNWITGAREGSFYLGRNSAVTRLHFFEACGSIHIGDNTIVAGRNSHFFTHGISSTNLDDVRPIVIGPWCYIGSSSRFTPGAGVSEGTFVGMGSVVTKPMSETFVLLAGAPAIVKKKLSPQDIYFNRPFLPHEHHPPAYDGREIR